MRRTHLVVDGSNIATEGRTAPSLAQLDEAVRGFLKQKEYEQTVVIVDATFGHRIDASEVASFEEAILAGELVTPPAGTIGRGDAFILQVARQADADVLSNDSFQELHAEHPWLFEAGRLWGGKPVPAVGWVFVGRAPVRGVTSRKVVQAAKTAAKKAAASKVAAGSKPEAKGRAGAKAKADTKHDSKHDSKQDATKAEAKVTAKAEATVEAGGRRRRRRGGGGGGGGGGGDAAGTTPGAARGGRLPANAQLVYASFVVEHPIGSTVRGVVDRFSSHGAYVTFGAAVGYVPLKSLGDPPPRSAREILTIGEERAFKVARFDPTTRGIDVVPTDVTASATSAAPSGRGEAATATALAGSPAPDAEEAPVSPVAKRPAKKKAAAKRAPARKKAAAKRAPARKKAAVKRAPARKKAAAKRAPARKKAAAKRAPARKKAAAKRAPARKKAAAKRAPARKKAAAKRAPARKAPARKKAAAKRAPARKAPARRRVAKKR